MLGRTNAVSASGGGSGDTIQAVNRTGGLINSGDKVWIVPQAQQAGDGFQLYRGSETNSNFLIDNDCNYIRCNTGLYYLGNDTVETVASGFNYLYRNGIYNYGGSSISQQFDGYKMNILINGEIILPNYTTSSADCFIPSNSSTMIYWYGNSAKTIYSYNKKTKETKKYTNVDGLSVNISYNCLFIIDDILYSAYASSSNKWYAKIDEGSASFTKLGDLTISGFLAYFIPKGILNDKKIIGVNYNETSGVVVAEIRNQNEVYICSSEEVSGLEECYVNTPNIYPMFFPDSQILTYVKWNNSSTINEFSYGVFKYLGDNKWQKLNIILPIDPPSDLSHIPTQYCQYLAISTDLTKCLIGYWNSSSRFMLYLYKLENYDGNNIYKYRREIITENCLTGKANQDIESGQSGEVSTVLLTVKKKFEDVAAEYMNSVQGDKSLADEFVFEFKGIKFPQASQNYNINVFYGRDDNGGHKYPYQSIGLISAGDPTQGTLFISARTYEKQTNKESSYKIGQANTIIYNGESIKFNDIIFDVSYGQWINPITAINSANGDTYIEYFQLFETLNYGFKKNGEWVLKYE